MAITIAEKSIDRICIIDDDDANREVMELTIEDSKMTPVSQVDSIDNLQTYLDERSKSIDAIVSDHHLKKRKNYFPVNGAEVGYHCYNRKIPFILVTRYEQADINEIRKFRQNIPVILKPDEFSPDSLFRSLEICIKEFKGNLSPERKPWRTLIRIDDVDSNHFFVVIPGWNPNETISINKLDLRDDLRENIKPDMRLHAKVNTGAMNANDLFFEAWELK